MDKTAASGAAKTMSPEKWARVKELFSVVVGSPVEQRHKVAQELCGADSELQSEIMKLLAAEEEAGSFLEPSRTETLFSSSKTATAQCLHPGQVVAGRFLIRHFIGRGGMGEVYEAWDNELQQKVALKTIRQEIAEHPGIISRFKAEVKESLRITHPNVCRVYQLACDEQDKLWPLWFLTMELLEGETLAHYLGQNGRIPVRRAMALIRQVAAGLACAHHASIVHRDLKPGNLMLVGAGTGEERLVITDFGLAVSSSSGERASAGGTPAYMAPEQSSGGQVGPQADIWALGLIICEMLTGQRPNLHTSSARECADDLRAWLVSHPAVPHRLRMVVRRCLRMTPQQRFRDATEITRLLDARPGNKAERAIAALIAAGALVAIGIVALPQIRDRVENEVQVTPNNVLSGEPSFSPDGKYLAYMSNRTNPERLDIWLQSPGASPRRLTSSGRENSSPSVSPDGRLVAFWSEREGGGIYLIGSEGGDERLLVPQGRNPSFSPDGSSVAYWLGAQDTERSGHIYLVSLTSGTVTRLASGFADARYPFWSNEGKIVFLGCRTGGDQRDWWVADPKGGEPELLGLLELLRRQHIEAVFPPQISVQGRHVIISGRTSGNYHLWDVVTSRSSLKPVSAPTQITFGENDEMAFALARHDIIALEHVTSDAHLWRVAAPGSDKTAGIAEKLTDNIQKDRCPAVSADGRWLFFARLSAKVLQIMKVELATGRESTVFVSDSNKLWPLPNHDGTTVAFESDTDNQSSILLLQGGRVRRLCSKCSHPGAWISDGKKLLYTTDHGDIAVLDIDTAESHALLQAGADLILAYPDYNVANHHLLFTAIHENNKQVFAVRLSEQGDQTVGRSMPLTEKNEQASMARWSDDGSKFFYLSLRDGYYCLWGNSFDAPQQVVGRPFSVKHYHAWDSGPSRTFPGMLGISVADNWVYFNPVEVRSTIWQGAVKRTLISQLLQLFSLY